MYCETCGGSFYDGPACTCFISKQVVDPNRIISLIKEANSITYEEFVTATNKNDSYECLLLGLGGEAGEVLDVYKKHLYKKQPLDVAKMIDELGDVLWYVTAIASKLGLSVVQLQERNQLKLKERQAEQEEDDLRIQVMKTWSERPE